MSHQTTQPPSHLTATCPHFGRELPVGHRCPPDCPVPGECLAALYGDDPATCSLCEAPATTLDPQAGPLCDEHFNGLNEPEVLEFVTQEDAPAGASYAAGIGVRR